MRQILDKLSTQVLRFVPFSLAFLVPLFFLPVTADFFIINKFYLVSVLASLSLVAWCIRSLVRGKLSLTSSPALFPLVLLSLTHIISSLWLSPIQRNSLLGMTTLFTALTIIFITATSSQKNRQVINSVILGLIASAVVLNIVTLLQYFGLLSKISQAAFLSNKYFNLTGGILPALTFTIPVLISTIAYLIVNKNWLGKSLLFASAIFMTVGSIINLSYIFPQDGKQTIVLLPYRESWSIAVDVLKYWKTALFGSGPETYFSTFTRLRPGNMNLMSDIWGFRFPESGSYLLTLVTTVGLLGALALLLAFLRPALLALKHRSEAHDPSFTFLTVALISTLLTYIFLPVGIVSLVLGVVIIIALTIEFKLLGYKSTKDIDFSISAKSNSDNIYHDLPDDRRFSPSGLVLPWVLTILSAVLLGAYWFFAIPVYAASVSLKQSSDMAQTNPVGAFQKQIDAAKLDPYNSTTMLTLSQFFKNATITTLQKNDLTDADKKIATEYMQRSIDFGKQAASVDPANVSVWENLADVYQAFIGYADNADNFAISHLAQAISLDPTNPALRLKLSILFYNLGDSDQAIKLMGQALDLKNDWDLAYFNMSTYYKSRKEYQRALQYMQAGLKYSTLSQEDLTKVQEEIKSLEKLVPAQSATPSATPAPVQ